MAFRGNYAASLLKVLHRQPGDDEASVIGKRIRNTDVAAQLTEIRECDRMDALEVIANLATITQDNSGVAHAQLNDLGVNGARIGRHRAHHSREDPPPSGEPGKPVPAAANRVAGTFAQGKPTTECCCHLHEGTILQRSASSDR